jgi:glycosyltransferase involved in cell wall biosynthesis
MHEETSPNADSVAWFLNEVAPKLRERLAEPVRISVVGVNGSPRVAARAGAEVEVTGPVQDLTGFYDRARLFVAPTRFGAGIPLKAYHAAAHGLPLVCTSLVARQLGWQDGVELLVADDPQAFAARCAELYRDARLWRSLRHNALDRIRAECSREAFLAKLAEILRAASPGAA